MRVSVSYTHLDVYKRQGLGIPQITQVFRALRQRGYPVSDTVYTVAQAKGEILRLLAARGAAR